MPKALALLAVLVALPGAAPAQTPPAVQAVPAARFVGVWVGTQAWAIANPPPGARADQPVTLTIELVNGKLSGTVKPFLGGEEGATFTDAVIVGDELQATAIVGGPRSASPSARRAPANWKDTVAVALSFENDGVTLKGRADVTMGEVPWTKFAYRLSKKRSRY